MDVKYYATQMSEFTKALNEEELKAKKKAASWTPNIITKIVDKITGRKDDPKDDLDS
jgi:hypothetical protein